jgi:hypothetical protein
LTGVVVIADDVHTHRSHAGTWSSSAVRATLTVKANQPKLHAQLDTLPLG